MGAAAGGGAAALNRTVATPDYNTHMQRSDEQRQRGVEQGRQAAGYAINAAEDRGEANIVDYRTGAKQIQSIYNDFLTRGAYNQGNENTDYNKQQTLAMFQQARAAIDTALREGRIPKDDADKLYAFIADLTGKVEQGIADNSTIASALMSTEGRMLGNL